MNPKRSSKARLVVGVLLLLAGAGGAYLAFSDQESEPVEISNAEELREIRDDLDGHYVLVEDIDLSHIDNFEPIGNSQDPFTGTFDGSGHTISNLTIDRPDEDSVGLFRYVGRDGTVENVGLTDVDVRGNTVVGSLVGSNMRGHNVLGSVRGSYVTGSVSGDGRVGGLVGFNSGIVEASYAMSSVKGNQEVGGLVGLNGGYIEEAYVVSNVTGDEVVGGLAGSNGGFINESYSMGNLTGNGVVGGLVGANGGVVKTSYTTSNVIGDEKAGGLVGSHDSFGVRPESSYWDINSTGQEISAGGTGLTTDEMTGSAARENMDGFDFDETWGTMEDDYPRLAWQSETDR